MHIWVISHEKTNTLKVHIFYSNISKHFLVKKSFSVFSLLKIVFKISVKLLLYRDFPRSCGITINSDQILIKSSKSLQNAKKWNLVRQKWMTYTQGVLCMWSDVHEGLQFQGNQ